MTRNGERPGAHNTTGHLEFEPKRPMRKKKTFIEKWYGS
jgi:hypothetical protein